jgi:hypothetical protein
MKGGRKIIRKGECLVNLNKYWPFETTIIMSCGFSDICRIGMYNNSTKGRNGCNDIK